MHSKRFRKLLSAATGAAILTAVVTGAPPSRAAEVTLRATSNLPSRVIYVRNFLDFVKQINKDGKGILQIKYLGGPEVTPSQKQGQALRTGIIDLNYGIASFYKGIVPQVDAMVGATIDAVESRKQGHTAYLNKIWNKRINAHFLAWFQSGYGWFIYLKDKPKLLASGAVDFSGLTIRSSPSTRDFVKALGATVGLIHSREVYTALERGVVNGNVFPGMGVTDYGWQKFLKWRIEPSFLQTNIVVMVNQDKWKSMPRKAREFLQSAAIKHEVASRDFIAGEYAKEFKKLKAAGMQVVTLQGKERGRYVQTARDVFWARLAKSVPNEVAELRRRFYQ